MNIYKRHRFPPDVISYAVWLWHRFNLSHRDIEELLAERGITVSHESIRLWCIKFATQFARRLRRKHAGFGDRFYIDKVFVRIGGKLQYLWRAVDQDGDVVGVFLQERRDARAAKRFVLLGLSVRLRLLVVVHCHRQGEDLIRIISARKADPSERKQYSEFLQ